MNPFVFSGASNLSDELIRDAFIQDHNYSRFIQSQRNVFLWGERGSGKTMTLLFNKIQLKEISIDQDEFNYIPVYISCITPLFHKREYLLLNSEFKSSLISEHYLVLSIIRATISSIRETNYDLSEKDEEILSSDFSYLFDIDIHETKNVLNVIDLFFRKEFIETQKAINQLNSDEFWDNTYSFSSLVLPMLETLKSCQKFNKTHFIFMLDDAHDLNKYQREHLNSWIAYRDNSLFSFKISAAKIKDYDLKTSSGGAILEGHDYISIDLEKPYQNNDSSFGKLALKIIGRRLEIANIKTSPDKFFPQHQSFIDGENKGKEKAKKDAIKKYGENAPKKKINDHIYKYGRANYFRELVRSKANRPSYSGLETITHLSTGVIRLLLEPCYWMYDDLISNDKKSNNEICEISPALQAGIIAKLSADLWEKIRDGVDREITDCSREQGVQVANLFEKLAELFRERLLDENCSEPRAISFSISAKNDSVMSQLSPIVDIARRAQLLYKRSGSAKDLGGMEDYFVPNRMLWPSRGLDPIGQHARVSIQAEHLLNACNGTKIPRTRTKDHAQQGDLFNDKV